MAEPIVSKEQWQATADEFTLWVIDMKTDFPANQDPDPDMYEDLLVQIQKNGYCEGVKIA